MRSAVAAFGLLAARGRRAFVALALVVGSVLAVGGVASAGLVHPFVGSFGSFANPQAVAVDQSTGNVFVLDAGSATVQKFDASGNTSDFSALGSNTLDGASGADLTPEGGFSFDSNSAAQLAVDNSGGAADGYLYVTNSFAGVVDVFDATGTFVGEIDGSAASPQTGFEPCGVAVDGLGNVYASYNEGHVDKYTPTDGDPAHDTFNGQLENLSGTCNVAVDNVGSVYVGGRFGGPLTKYDPSQFGQSSPSGSNIDDTNLAVAVDQATGDIYSDHGAQIYQYDSTGALRGKTGTAHLSGGSFGVAVNAGSGNVYASDAGTANVLQFGPALSIEVPAVTIDQPSNITTTGATLTGTVNPSGADPLSDTTWHFEYSTDGGGSFTSTQGGDVGIGTTPQQVSDQISGLIPNEQVQVRLVATNAADTTTSSDEFFTTTPVAPTVTTQSAEDVALAHATLLGAVNPNGSPTTYYFEYGPTTAYGISVPTSQDASAGAERVTSAVIQWVGGLQPGTIYHFRLVATNQAGTTLGQDQTLATTTEPPPSTARSGIPGTGFLPDQRGWEKISPSDKNGGDIMADSQLVRAASDGNAIDYASLAAFGDVVGTSVATEYTGIRSTLGWTTHSITPPQKALTLRPTLAGLGSLYVGFSGDLSTGVFLGWTPVTSDLSVANVPNLYLRNDVKTAGVGSYQLLSGCPLCQSTSTTLPGPLGNSGGAGQPWFAGASADLGHVIFESQERLTSDAAPGCNNDFTNTNQCPGNLYEWDHGAVRLAGILPDNACGAPPCPAPGSQAGVGAGSFHNGRNYTPHTISADGARIFFSVPHNKNVYMRVNHAMTIALNTSERAPNDPRGIQQATYADASTDGSRIFFTSKEALTNDAQVDSAIKLYMYDASKPDSDPHNLTLLSRDNEPDDGGTVQAVVAVSADGHYVYFATTGRLISGQPVSAAERLLYVWHDGTLQFVAGLGAADLREDSVNGDWTANTRVSRVTPDGRTLLFGSQARTIGPTGYQQTCVDGSVCRQLYVYSHDSQRLACASCNPGGALATGSTFPLQRMNSSAAVTSPSQNHALSNDGRDVFFSSPDALVPQDVNGKRDVYEYDVPSATLHLISTGRDPSDSFFLDASASGNDVFFVTRAQLTGTDTDGGYDLYDARVGGGFPEPPPIAPACSGEACRAPQSPLPDAATPGSGAVTANANGSLPTKAKTRIKPCRKGTRSRVHRKLRCVKVRKPRHTPKGATKVKRANSAHGRPR